MLTTSAVDAAGAGCVVADRAPLPLPVAEISFVVVLMLLFVVGAASVSFCVSVSLLAVAFAGAPAGTGAAGSDERGCNCLRWRCAWAGWLIAGGGAGRAGSAGNVCSVSVRVRKPLAHSDHAGGRR